MSDILSVLVVALGGGLILFALQLAIWSLIIRTPEQASKAIRGLVPIAIAAALTVVAVNFLRLFFGREPTIAQFITMPLIVAWVFTITIIAVTVLKKRKNRLTKHHAIVRLGQI